MRRRQKTILPIIIATAQGLKGDEEAYLARGADAYFKKPLFQDNLRDTLAAGVSA